MRVAFKKQPVLEGAGLALVAVDGHEARAFFGAHETPFPPGRETGAAQTPQPAVGKSPHHIFDSVLA